MASPETFESTLKEVVRAKRLSASKVKDLTDITLKTIKNDTKLVSILYRMHKSLSPAHKINSLYAFDALSRAARSQVNKHSLTGDLNTEPGNCATFLLKVEGVLDGLFQDMLKTEHPEAKDKTKKILDIWVKGHTFPSDVLTRLQKLVKEATEKEPEKESSTTPAVTADPRLQAAAPVVSPPPTLAPTASTTPPAGPATAVQSTLLALLSQAANVVASSGNGQTAPNSSGIPPAAGAAGPAVLAPQLDSRQLALFQQLAQVANAGYAGATQPVPVPSLVPSAAPANAVPVAPPFGGPSQSLPYRDESNGFAAPRDTRYDSHNGPQRGREYYDHRRDPKGDFRGPPRNDHSRDPRGEYRSEPHRGDFRGGPRGGFRGRGRGRWDDRDHHLNKSRENRWHSPQSRNPNSRSRSPVARNGRRPFSPPHDGPGQHPRSPPARPPPADHTNNAGKDEFGRDLRPQSPDGEVPASAPKQFPEISPLPSEPAPIVYTADQVSDGQQEELPSSTHSMPPDVGVANASVEAGPSQPGATGGLEAFDWNTFDYTSPASWESLGEAWNASHGYLPSQDELMQYFMMISSSMGSTYPVSGQYDMQQNQQWAGQQQQSWGRGRGGRGRGRGYGDYGQSHSYGYGNGRGGSRGPGRGFDQETDALTLVGGDDTPPYGGPQDGQGWQEEGGYDAHQPPMEDVDEDAGGNGGRMQKLGDRWVFVKADAS